MKLLQKLRDNWNWYVAEFNKNFDEAMKKRSASTEPTPTTIDELVLKYEPPNWTEEELIEWVNSKPEKARLKITQLLKQATEEGFGKEKILKILRKARVECDRLETQKTPTLLGVLEGIAGLVEYDQDLRYRYSKGSAMENLANKK